MQMWGYYNNLGFKSRRKERALSVGLIVSLIVLFIVVCCIKVFKYMILPNLTVIITEYITKIVSFYFLEDGIYTSNAFA